ncbi:MAG: class I SAM-dependent methyltransferase [Promethearchaeota archaeon]|jgi:cyclopropane fatty-acyl-phospholipid synthase-like methyltransferase
MNEEDIDKIYREVPVEKIPWIYETPPSLLVELINNGTIQPGKTLELGCGIGNYVIYLTTKGFDTTGIDLSPTAIELAKQKSSNLNVDCKFHVADVTSDLSEHEQKYDFIYDWELLHHIFPEKRKKYLTNVKNLLNPGGLYLSVSFSDKDPSFSGVGKYRKTPMGTVLYFSSGYELEQLFMSFFDVEVLKTIEIRGKPVPHIANYGLMKN